MGVILLILRAGNYSAIMVKVLIQNESSSETILKTECADKLCFSGGCSNAGKSLCVIFGVIVKLCKY